MPPGQQPDLGPGIWCRLTSILEHFDPIFDHFVSIFDHFVSISGPFSVDFRPFPASDLGSLLASLTRFGPSNPVLEKTNPICRSTRVPKRNRHAPLGHPPQ